MDKMNRAERRRIEMAKRKELKKARKQANQSLKEDMRKEGHSINIQQELTNRPFFNNTLKHILSKKLFNTAG